MSSVLNKYTGQPRFIRDEITGSFLGVRALRESDIIDAAHGGHLEVVKFLVEELGADVHYKGDQALCWAAGLGRLPVVKYLVKRGADVHADHNAPLRWAVQYGDYAKVAKYLIKRGADVHAYEDEALRWAAGLGHIKSVKVLIKAGADVRAQDDSAVKDARAKGHTAVVEYIQGFYDSP